MTGSKAHGILVFYGEFMNLFRSGALLALGALSGAAALAQQTQPGPAPAEPATKPSAPATEAAPQPSPDSARAQAYYNYTMGHIYEQQFESTGDPANASQSIGFYKKAFALDPKSPIIGERLAEMYWKAQRVREAVNEAQAILAQNPDDVNTHRLLGRIYLRSLGDLNGVSGQSETIAKAAAQFQQVHRLDPSDTESALWLARLYRLQNNTDQAGEVLREILKNDPENEPAVEQLTQLLLDQGKSAEAVALLEGIEKRSGAPSAAVLDLLGEAYTQTKDLSKAEDAYRRAVQADPSELSHQRGLGQTLLDEEKYQDALQVYLKISDVMPDDADVYLRLAQIYRQLHQLDKAEASLLKARQYAPGSLEVLYNEAVLYESQGRFDDAIRVLSDAVAGLKGESPVLPSRRRSLAVLYEQLGMLYRESGNYQAAINTYGELGHLGEEEDRRARILLMETYRTERDLPKALQAGKDALAKYPEDALVKTSYALLLGENGQTDQAVALLQTQLSAAGNKRETYLNIAQVYERAKRFREAEEVARKAEALPGQPRDNEMTWFLLGAIYERQKEFDRAETEFKKVLAVNPKNAPVLNYYGYMLGDLDIRLGEAESLVQRALREEPQNGAYLDSIGWIYYKEGKLAEAEAALRKAVAREPHDPTILSHLGDVYAKGGRMEMAAGEWEKSLNEWRRALPADVENDKIAEVEKKLGQMKHRVAQKAAPAEAKP